MSFGVYLLVGAFILFIAINNIVQSYKKNQNLSEEGDSPNTDTKKPINRKMDKPPASEKPVAKTLKKKCYEFEVVGMYYYLNSKEDVFPFWLETELDNRHDKYAIKVLTEHGRLVGHLKRGNTKLYQTLNLWHNGKVRCFGKIYFTGWEKKDEWQGYVYVNPGLDSVTEDLLIKYDQIFKQLPYSPDRNLEKEIESFNKLIQLKKYAQNILDRQEETDFNVRSMEGKCFYKTPPINGKFLNGFSGRLEKNKLWDQLVELEQLSDLIEKLSDKNKQTVIKRIEKAKRYTAT